MGSDTGTIVTVDGRLDPEDAGVAITHEHLFVDVADAWYDPPDESYERELAEDEIRLENLWYVRRNSLAHRENVRLDSLGEAIDEVSRYHRAGGDLLVDVTPKNIGRDPERVRGVARETGLNVVHGTAYYTKPAHPPGVEEMSTGDIEAEFVSDVREGIGDTDVQAGIIGELGTSGDVLDEEKRVLRAGARAALRTGASVTIHPPLMESEYPPSHYAHEILDVLTDEGLPAERVVLGHQDMVDELDHPDIDDQLELAERGAFVEFDLWGWEAYITGQEHAAPSDNWRAKATMEFIDQDLHSQLLFSHDVNHKWQRTKYGGFGYAHLLENIVPMLESHGVDQEALDQVFVENPRRMLTFTEPE